MIESPIMSEKNDETLNTTQKHLSFPTLDQMYTCEIELSERFGFKRELIGYSESGREIYMITAGDGPKKALIWGFPHPNEPIGALTIDTLLNQIGESGEDYGYTWHCIFCIDPDGASRNELWFENPTFENFMRHFYKQPAGSQIDWNFPYSDEDFTWQTTLPETEILIELMERIKPDLIYPLHNSVKGGAYLFNSRDFGQEYYKAIIALSNELGIPLHLGEPELPFMVPVTDQLPAYHPITRKDYMNHSPKTARNAGNSSSGYFLERINPNGDVIVTEVPYFTTPAINDTSPSEKTRYEISRDMYLSFQESYDNLAKIAQEILNVVGIEQPLRLIAEDIVNKSENRFWASKAEELQNIGELMINATVGQVLDLQITTILEEGLTASNLKQVATSFGSNERVLADLDEIVSKCAGKAKELGLTTLPIDILVTLQLEALLALVRQ